MAGFTRRRFLQAVAGAGAISVLPGLRAAARATVPAGGVWLAGDLHCHTVLSHDVWGGPGDDNTGPDQAYTYGWTAGQQIANAETRRLDFLAVTDHDRTDALFLPEYTSSNLTLLPGYEHSLAGGHAGVFVPDKSVFIGAGGSHTVLRDTDGGTSFTGDAALGRFVDQVHGLGGITVLNHPFYGNSGAGDAVAWGYTPDASQYMDAVEVWNINWAARHDTNPVADSDNYLSLPWWEREIVSRRHIPAVGGSDNHYVATFAVQGVGQPTTWVYAADRSVGAIFDAIRAGRTFVSSEPPLLAGPRLLLDVHEDWAGGGKEMVGGSVGALGPLVATVRVEHGAGATLRLVSGGQVVGATPVLAPTGEYSFPMVLPEGGWLRAELYLSPGYWMSALTSPVYAGADAPLSVRRPPTTGPAVAYGPTAPAWGPASAYVPACSC